MVSWATRAALLVPLAAGPLLLELGRGRHGANNLHLETDTRKRGSGEDGWTEREGVRREAVGVSLGDVY